MVIAVMLNAGYMTPGRGKMADILFIKTSSLGDVIHHMPALTEAREARPGASFTWLVEEAFAPLVRLHPAVGAVIPVAWRRWRKSLYAPATLAEIAGSLRAIRTQHYDLIVDSQGLLRSGVIARLAHGRRHGYDATSIREPLASPFYDVRHSVSRELHAVERNRMLSGLALGYVPQGAPDFGLDRARFGAPGERYAVLLHATARTEKQWPEANWIALGHTLAGQGIGLVLPWGTDVERARSERIAGARAPHRCPTAAQAQCPAPRAYVRARSSSLPATAFPFEPWRAAAPHSARPARQSARDRARNPARLAVHSQAPAR